jgi:hypothetical protein
MRRITVGNGPYRDRPPPAYFALRFRARLQAGFHRPIPP